MYGTSQQQASCFVWLDGMAPGEAIRQPSRALWISPLLQCRFSAVADDSKLWF
jgi:hypothetical protein